MLFLENREQHLFLIYALHVCLAPGGFAISEQVGEVNIYGIAMQSLVCGIHDVYFIEAAGIPVVKRFKIISVHDIEIDVEPVITDRADKFSVTFQELNPLFYGS